MSAKLPKFVRLIYLYIIYNTTIMILKHPLAFILTATLALGTFTACSNDDPAPMRPNLPAAC